MADKKARDVMSPNPEFVGEDDRLVGIISQADVATNVDEQKVGDLVEAISAAQ
jgi:predicted transcriptional regulator